jgi:FkbM family methyltransferase
LLRFVPADLHGSVIAHLPRVGGASAILPNGKQIRMYCGEPETILNDLYYHGWTAQEEEVLPLWYALAAEARVVVDIGAHVGHFSLVAGLANPHAQIFSFEPLPRVVSLLRRNVKINGLTNIEIRPRALGSSPGKLPFYAVPDGIPSSSSLSRDFMLSGAHEISEILVDVSTLDAEQLPRDVPAIIKIDTETTEPAVIAGGRGFIRKTQPLMIIEVLDQQSNGEALALALHGIGYDYDAFLLTGKGAVRREILIGDPIWRNFLIVPKDLSKLGPLISVLNCHGITNNR